MARTNYAEMVRIAHLASNKVAYIIVELSTTCGRGLLNGRLTCRFEYAMHRDDNVSNAYLALTPESCAAL